MKFTRASGKYIVARGGRPIVLYHGAGLITVLADLPKAEMEQALRTILSIVDRPPKVEQRADVNVRDWNGHPIDVSPGRHLLTRLGFVESGKRWTGMAYDGRHTPDEATVARAEAEMPDVFERAGKEDAPVTYDAEWLVSRSPAAIRPKMAELIEVLPGLLPDECEIVFEPRRFIVRYRGVRCMNLHIQQKQAWLHITHSGWRPGIRIEPGTDLESGQFAEAVLTRFEQNRTEIDELLARPARRPPV